LRAALDIEGAKLGWKTYIPQMQYCTDNAGMIAMAAYYKYLENQFSDLKMAPMPRLQI